VYGYSAIGRAILDSVDATPKDSHCSAHLPVNRNALTLIRERNRVANRVQKVLEDANIKLASVASDALGLSRRSMLEAIVKGERDPETLAGLARWLLRRKLDDLRLALDGKITEHHKFCLKQLLAQYDFVNGQIDELEQEIARRSAGMQEAVRLLDTIPGIDEIAARAAPAGNHHRLCVAGNRARCATSAQAFPPRSAKSFT
jgi:transposase